MKKNSSKKNCQKNMKKATVTPIPTTKMEIAQLMNEILKKIDHSPEKAAIILTEWISKKDKKTG